VRDGLAVPGQVERQRAIALRVQIRDHPIPSAARAAEAMQQDQRLQRSDMPLRHPAILEP
jgi:hypothetical protein